MLVTLYFKSLKPDINLKINYIKLTLFLLFLFGSISLLWSVNIDFAIGKWLLWLITFFSFILSLNLSLTHRNLVKLSWGLVLAAGMISFIGLLQFYFNPFSLTQSAWPGSTFGNKNMAIQPLVLILPLSIFLLLSRDTQSTKVWALIGIISLTFTYILISESRAAWLSILIEISLILIYFITFKTKILQWIDWNNNKRNASIFAVLITIILINITPSSEWESLSFSNTLSNIGERIISTGSNADGASFQRLQIWKISINMILDAPLFGTGLGSFAQNLGNEGYATWTINNTMRAHNDLLELAVELGAIWSINLLFSSNCNHN